MEAIENKIALLGFLALNFNLELGEVQMFSMYIWKLAIVSRKKRILNTMEFLAGIIASGSCFTLG